MSVLITLRVLEAGLHALDHGEDRKEKSRYALAFTLANDTLLVILEGDMPPKASKKVLSGKTTRRTSILSDSIPDSEEDVGHLRSQ